MSGPHLIAINVGNTRAQVGLFEDGKLTSTQRFANESPASAAEWIVQHWRRIADIPQAAIVMASVNDPAADRLSPMIEDQLTVEVYRIGDDLPVPIGVDLDPETITGSDRLLNAAAAFDKLRQACIVVDAGTAVTVDFVDGEGTFHGGAIAPGARMQLHALHEHTAALPDIEFTPPNGEAFGKSTSQAMLKGVFHGIRGMVWRLVEMYAERYGAYPQVIATGGDADALFRDDELVDRIVPELTLFGIAAAARQALTQNDEHEVDREAE